MTWRKGYGIEYPISEDHHRYAMERANDKTFIPRGDFDGSPQKKYAGILGQTIVADLLEVERPEHFGKPDGGTDFYIYGKRIDIKTAIFKGRPYPGMRSYLKASQLEQGDTDVYLFSAYSTADHVFCILGWIKKIDISRAHLRYEGTEERMGASYVHRYPTDTYAIPAADLRPWESVSSFLTDMTMFG